MHVKDVITQQQRKIATLSRLITKQSTQVEQLVDEMGRVKEMAKANEKLKSANQAMKMGVSFRDLMERAAEMVLPFHYITELSVPASSTDEITNTIPTSSRGWFFADRVRVSFISDSQNNPNMFRPICHSNPIVAMQAVSGGGADPILDVPDFRWGYSENRTDMARQNDQLLIPGDLLFRNDNDGYLLGGDPWHPRSTITVKSAMLNGLDADGTLIFVFTGALCMGTTDASLQAWVERKQLLGL